MIGGRSISTPLVALLLTMAPQIDDSIIDATPKDLNDGIPVSTLRQSGGDIDAILGLAEDIVAGKHEHIESLLIAHQGKLVFESYYRQGRPQLPHYQMSVTKSVTAFALGRAIQLGVLGMADLDRPVVDFLQEVDQSSLAPGAASITVADCLNMHSGIRVAQEKWAEAHRDPSTLKGQRQAQVYLSLTDPVTEESKTWKYQAVDSSLVMQVIEAVVPGSARDFIDREFLGKLGITDYEWPAESSGLPQSNAGMSLRSRDMLKLGMLAAQNGKWQGEPLISEAFVRKAVSPIHRNNEGISYGYFWFGQDYKLDGKIYPSTSCRGAGGQVILLIPGAGLIIAVTSDTEGGRSLEIPLRGFVPKIILPAFLRK